MKPALAVVVKRMPSVCSQKTTTRTSPSQMPSSTPRRVMRNTFGANDGEHHHAGERKAQPHQRAHGETAVEHNARRRKAEAPYRRHQRDDEHGAGVRDGGGLRGRCGHGCYPTARTHPNVIGRSKITLLSLGRPSPDPGLESLESQGPRLPAGIDTSAPAPRRMRLHRQSDIVL